MLAFLIVLLASAAAELYTSADKIADLVDLHTELQQLVAAHTHTESTPVIAELAVGSTLHAGDAFVVVFETHACDERLRALVAQDPVGYARLRMFRAARAAELPTAADVQGASEALLRLQRIYLKPVAELLPRATTQHLQHVGRVALGQHDFFAAYQWFTAAVRQINAVPHRENGNHDTLAALAELQVYAAQRMGAVPLALSLATAYSSNAWAVARRNNWLDTLESLLYAAARQSPPSPPVYNFDPDNLLSWNSSDTRVFRSLCRGETTASSVVKSVSRHPCTLETFGMAYLRYAPLAVESVLRARQNVMLFRNVLSAAECAHLVAISRVSIERSTAGKSNSYRPVDFRISQNTWVPHDHDQITAAIVQRAAWASGRAVQSAEELQVANYGTGGHYEPHFDWAPLTSNMSTRYKTDGNRLATLMFYLSDVEEGGFTVFPRLGVIGRPRKGDAIFWMNMQDGELDYDTLHAGCPVLSGNKWVANLWFHENHNYPYHKGDYVFHLPDTDS